MTIFRYWFLCSVLTIRVHQSRIGKTYMHSHKRERAHTNKSSSLSITFFIGNTAYTVWYGTIRRSSVCFTMDASVSDFLLICWCAGTMPVLSWLGKYKCEYPIQFVQLYILYLKFIKHKYTTHKHAHTQRNYSCLSFISVYVYISISVFLYK